MLHNISPNVRIDYKGSVDGVTHGIDHSTDSVTGTCLKPNKDETVESLCKRVQNGDHCKIPTKCKKMVRPTDGCCPICGKPHSSCFKH